MPSHLKKQDVLLYDSRTFRYDFVVDPRNPREILCDIPGQDIVQALKRYFMTDNFSLIKSQIPFVIVKVNVYAVTGRRGRSQITRSLLSSYGPEEILSFISKL